MSNAGNKNKLKHDPLPEHFETLDEAAEFWDTHDSGDYEEFLKDVPCDFDLQKRTYLVSGRGTPGE